MSDDKITCVLPRGPLSVQLAELVHIYDDRFCDSPAPRLELLVHVEIMLAKLEHVLGPWHLEHGPSRFYCEHPEKPEAQIAA